LLSKVLIESPFSGRFGGGAGFVNGKAVAVAAVQYNTKNIAYEVVGNKDSGIG